MAERTEVDPQIEELVVGYIGWDYAVGMYRGKLPAKDQELRANREAAYGTLVETVSGNLLEDPQRITMFDDIRVSFARNTAGHRNYEDLFKDIAVKVAELAQEAMKPAAISERSSLVPNPLDKGMHDRV